MFITELQLENFRNHKSISIKPEKDTILLTGSNGTGKTSILEAISMLSPGKGILNSDISQQNNIEYFSRPVRVDQSGKVQSDSNIKIKNKVIDNVNMYNINASLDNTINVNIESRKKGAGFEKAIYISDKKCKSQIELTNWCDVIWFSAKQQHDLDKSQFRRNIIDRLVFYCNHEHSDRIKGYEKLVKSRMATLRDNNLESRFLDAIESQIAEFAFNIAEARISTTERINSLSLEHGGDSIEDSFKVHFKVNNPIEERVLNNDSKSEIKEFIKKELFDRRNKDLITEQTTFGTHKSKVEILNILGIHFQDLSSGQQKLLFLFMTKIFAKMIYNIKNRKPIILLDEIISFLDERNILFAIKDFKETAAQTWMTSPTNIPSIHDQIQVIPLD